MQSKRRTDGAVAQIMNGSRLLRHGQVSADTVRGLQCEHGLQIEPIATVAKLLVGPDCWESPRRESDTASPS